MIVVVGVDIVVVVVILHHLVTILFAEQRATDEGVAIAGHKLRLTFGTGEALDVVDSTSGVGGRLCTSSRASGSSSPDTHHQFVGGYSLTAS